MLEIGHIIIVLLLSFTFSVIFGYFFIKFQLRKKIGQNIREDGPKSHHVKSGVPTFGGIIFLSSAVVTLILIYFFADLSYSYDMLIIGTVVLGYAILGFIDDWLNVKNKRSRGLSVIQKLIGQFLIAIIAYILLTKSNHEPTLEVFILDVKLDLGIFYTIFILMFLVGFSNAVNITDGLDGLATGLSIMALTVYALIAWRRTTGSFGAELVPYDIELAAFTMVGALIGFLVYNINPAKIFMGDTGSMALGSMLAIIAILTRHEVTLIIVGGVFVIEIMSVVIQVLSYKTTKKRVFLMSPIHHHFELLGWNETQIVRVFWVCGFIFALLGLLFGVVL